MQENLIKVWKACGTRRLSDIFKKYMASLDVAAQTSKTEDNSNTYSVNGKTWDWDKVECRYYKEFTSYGNSELWIVLRKAMGSYFIIGKHGKRAFEADHHGIIHYDEKLLAEIIADHEPLFQKLFAMVA